MNFIVNSKILNKTTLMNYQPIFSLQLITLGERE
jgi:hypothetical protein